MRDGRSGAENDPIPIVSRKAKRVGIFKDSDGRICGDLPQLREERCGNNDSDGGAGKSQTRPTRLNQQESFEAYPPSQLLGGESWKQSLSHGCKPVSYTHLRAHETPEHLVCRLLL